MVIYKLKSEPPFFSWPSLLTRSGNTFCVNNISIVHGWFNLAVARVLLCVHQAFALPSLLAKDTLLDFELCGHNTESSSISIELYSIYCKIFSVSLCDSLARAIATNVKGPGFNYPDIVYVRVIQIAHTLGPISKRRVPSFKRCRLEEALLRKCMDRSGDDIYSTTALHGM